MSRGEFLHHQQSDHNADINRIQSQLENLSPESAELWSDSLYRQTVDEWEQCNRSFNGLFNRLNLYNARELNLFDIIIDEGEVETYIRVQKGNEGDYSTTELLRQDGRIVNYGPTETLSDTYEFRFGPDNGYVATISLRKDTEPGIALERDGNPMEQRTQYETSVLIAALETEVLPSIERSRKALKALWGAVQNIEINGN